MLKIISAIYGNKDVTDILSEYVVDNKLDIIVSNNIFGDPLPNVYKYLKVKYLYNGVLMENKFGENHKCELPSDKIEYVCNPNKKIKFIIPLPDIPYYLWQILVQINNFRKLGYEIDTHYLVCYFKEPSNILKNFVESVNIKSTFHLYLDTMPDKTYMASMKPWLMSQYFKQHPEEKDNIYIYLDPDVIFFNEINWCKYTHDDIWYESDTRIYLDSNYIKSKSEQLFLEMCSIVDISPDIVIDNDINAGGAQYVTKNNTYEMWNEIQELSIPLYKHMVETSDRYKPEGEIYPIQAWTSEMWTTNWTLWKKGIQTKCDDDLHFHWAGNMINELSHSIYHNAGVVDDDGVHFAKTSYQISPFYKNIKCSEDSISYKYVEEIKDTEFNFPELVTLF